MTAAPTRVGWLTAAALLLGGCGTAVALPTPGPGPVGSPVVPPAGRPAAAATRLGSAAGPAAGLRATAGAGLAMAGARGNAGTLAVEEALWEPDGVRVKGMWLAPEGAELTCNLVAGEGRAFSPWTDGEAVAIVDGGRFELSLPRSKVPAGAQLDAATTYYVVCAATAADMESGGTLTAEATAEVTGERPEAAVAAVATGPETAPGGDAGLLEVTSAAWQDQVLVVTGRYRGAGEGALSCLLVAGTGRAPTGWVAAGTDVVRQGEMFTARLTPRAAGAAMTASGERYVVCIAAPGGGAADGEAVVEATRRAPQGPEAVP